MQDNETEALKIKPIFDDLTLQWTQGYNLTLKKEVLIPFNWFYMINEFNGPCAGNCDEEALIQGLCELVERHTSSLVSHGNLKVPGIRTDTFTDPLVKEMLAKYKACGIQILRLTFLWARASPPSGSGLGPCHLPEKARSYGPQVPRPILRKP